MKSLSSAALVLAAGLALTATPALAQFSKSYDFLDAVKKADAEKVTDALAQPGTTLINTHDDSNGQTALMIVTARRDVAWMNFLIAKGADVNAHDNHDQTPLEVASGLGFSEGALVLVQHGATVDEPNDTGETPLIAAVHRRDLAMIHVLLTGGANPNRADNSGRSAHDYAALMGTNNAVSAMLDSAVASHKSGGATYGPSM